MGGTYQHVPIQVIITVSIGDQGNEHILRFAANATARGGAYHGETPAYPGQTILEREIRGVIDTLIARATKDTTRFVAHAYPVHTDQEGTPDV